MDRLPGQLPGRVRLVAQGATGDHDPASVVEGGEVGQGLLDEGAVPGRDLVQAVEHHQPAPLFELVQQRLAEARQIRLLIHLQADVLLQRPGAERLGVGRNGLVHDGQRRQHR